MRITILLFIILNSFAAQSRIDRSAFYDALASENLSEIEQMIGKLEKETQTTTISAYKGALLAKKANFIVKAGEKLNVFKAGVELLEGAIEKAPEKAEYRFIRLSIQEHAPKILKYRDNIEEDKKMICAKFSAFDSKLAQIVKDYTKESTVLLLEDLH